MNIPLVLKARHLLHRYMYNNSLVLSCILVFFLGRGGGALEDKATTRHTLESLVTVDGIRM